jgi:hypothetical protein
MTDAQMPIPAEACAQEDARQPFWVQDHPAHAGRPSKHARGLIRCPRCDSVWTGLSACHCAACHRTFSGYRAFDIHRTGSRCNDPASLLDIHGEPRLVPIARQYWSGWGRPGDDPRFSADD